MKVEGSQPTITLSDVHGKSRATLSLTSKGAPNTELSDPEGYRLDFGSAKMIAPETGTTQQTSAASIVMFGNDKEHRVM